MAISTGTIRYSPQTLHTQEKWWVVVDCDPELGKYYRYMYNKWAPWSKLQRPAWEEHISVVRNEEPPIKDMWRAYEGRQVEFEYSTEVEAIGLYFWLPVKCSFFGQLRVELGLAEKPIYDFHLTIGNKVQ